MQGLRAVVIGAGWAGQGHTVALQSCGVEVVAICARDQSVVANVAEKLGIPVASTDWRATLRQIKPDIVSLAVPASLREEVVREAVALGCHVVCEKPLAKNADEAKRLLNLVNGAGIKHAYAASQCFDPTVTWIKELLSAGTIGQVKSVETILHAPAYYPNAPWTWNHDLSQGGGVLANALTHMLENMRKILGGEPTRVMGATRTSISKAPYIGPVHDFRLANQTLDEQVLSTAEWRHVDADTGLNAIVAYTLPTGETVDCAFVVDGAVQFPDAPPVVRFYGDRGTLVATGAFTFDVTVIGPDGRLDKPIPDRLREGYPETGDDAQNKWNVFFRKFISNVRREALMHDSYPTFREGYQAQQIIDIIREGRGWTHIVE